MPASSILTENGDRHSERKVKEQEPKTDPSPDTGRALNYSLNQETYLRTFLENGEVPLDNNDAERSIKKFCVGNKNWQIATAKNGAEASGTRYSIVETAVRTDCALLLFQACAENNDSAHER